MYCQCRPGFFFRVNNKEKKKRLLFLKVELEKHPRMLDYVLTRNNDFR